MSFSVTVLPAGTRFEVLPHETVLAAGIRQNVGLPYGCKDGACSSCKSRLIEGQVTHREHQVKALSPEEEAAGSMLTCCATPLSDLTIQVRTVPGSGEFPVRKMPCRVLSLTRAAPDVMVLQLQLPTGQPLQYRAGQYIEFMLAGGDRRSYSMASSPQEQAEKPTMELHIRHMPGGKFTDQVFSTLKEKAMLRLEGPFGSFFLREDSDKPVVLLASGTGFAPIKAILEHMQAKGVTREAVLYWGCRSRADLYLDGWVRDAAARMPNLRYIPVLSDAKPEDNWTGRTGFVHQAVMSDLPDLSGYQVYACGAPVMVDSAQRDFVARCGLPQEEFYADAFTSEADKHAASA